MEADAAELDRVANRLFGVCSLGQAVLSDLTSTIPAILTVLTVANLPQC